MVSLPEPPPPPQQRLLPKSHNIESSLSEQYSLNTASPIYQRYPPDDKPLYTPEPPSRLNLPIHQTNESMRTCRFQSPSKENGLLSPVYPEGYIIDEAKEYHMDRMMAERMGELRPVTGRIDFNENKDRLDHKNRNRRAFVATYERKYGSNMLGTSLKANNTHTINTQLSDYQHNQKHREEKHLVKITEGPPPEQDISQSIHMNYSNTDNWFKNVYVEKEASCDRHRLINLRNDMESSPVLPHDPCDWRNRMYNNQGALYPCGYIDDIRHKGRGLMSPSHNSVINHGGNTDCLGENGGTFDLYANGRGKTHLPSYSHVEESQSMDANSTRFHRVNGRYGRKHYVDRLTSIQECL